MFSLMIVRPLWNHIYDYECGERYIETGMTYGSARLAHKMAARWNAQNAHVDGFADDIHMEVFHNGQKHYEVSSFRMPVVSCSGCEVDCLF